MTLYAKVDKDWKAKGEHDDTFAQEGNLYCTTCRAQWPCEQSTRGIELANEKKAAAAKAAGE